MTGGGESESHWEPPQNFHPDSKSIRTAVTPDRSFRPPPSRERPSLASLAVVRFLGSQLWTIQAFPCRSPGRTPIISWFETDWAAERGVRPKGETRHFRLCVVSEPLAVACLASVEIRIGRLGTAPHPENCCSLAIIGSSAADQVCVVITQVAGPHFRTTDKHFPGLITGGRNVLWRPGPTYVP